MKRFFLILLACVTPVLAQISVTPGESSATPTVTPMQTQVPPTDNDDVAVRRAEPVKPTPSPYPAPQKKSRSFFGFFRRLFGLDHSVKTTGTPKPTAAPRATAVKPSASVTPSPKVTPKPSTTPKEIPAQSATPKTSPTPAEPPKATPTPKASPTPKSAVAPIATPPPVATPKTKPAPTTKSTPGETPTSIPSVMSSGIEDTKYAQLKQQALSDAKVKALLEKMNTEPEGSDAYKAAAHNYTKALFNKMRKLDPSQEEALTRKEGAYNRRIDAGKAILE